MRILMTCMLLCGAVVGYSQDGEESPVELTTGDEGSGDGSVAVNEGLVNWNCGCTKDKDNKPK